MACWRRCGRAPAGRRPCRSARHLEWARRQGLPVPAVVAAGESIGPWGRLQSFLAVEELTDMLPLHEAIPAAAARQSSRRRSHTGNAAWSPRWPGWHASFICSAASTRISTCATSTSRADDIEAAPASWRGRMHMIDLHRLGHHPLTWRLWQVKDLAELLTRRKSPASPPATGCGSGGITSAPTGGSAAWWLKRAVLLKWRRYRQHNAKKRATQSRFQRIDHDHREAVHEYRLLL